MDLENTEKTFTEEAIKATFSTVLSQSKAIGLKFKEEVKLHKAINNYVENYLHRHGQIKVLGMPKPIPLRSLYINVDVTSPTYLNLYQTLEGLEKSYQEKNKRRFYDHTITRKPGIDLANKEQYLNVLGSPGTGKTTFLKRIGLEALLPKSEKKGVFGSGNSYYKHANLPVLIELKRFKNEEIDIFELIKKEFATCNFPESDRFVEKYLEEGKLLILLDGLDEVPNEILDIVITHIQDFADKYKKNRYITSCRTAFYKTYFRNFVDIEISDFDDNQIKKFVLNWFSGDVDLTNKTGNNFIDLLFNYNQRATLELARTPLLLTFLCLVYDDSNKFPPNRSLLYRKAFSILLERWAAEKRVHNDLIYKDFHSDIEIEMLADIAYEMYEVEKIFFTKNDLLNSINVFFEKALNVKSRVNSSQILEAIEIHQGLLVQRANEIYSFSHLTIQEYLTSHYYFSKSKISELVNNHLFDFRWREVFLLLAGMSNIDKLLDILTNRLSRYLNENKKVAEYIKWSQRIVIPNDDPEQNLARRLFVLSIPLLFVRYPEGEWHGGYFADYYNIPLQVSSLLKGGERINYEKNLNKKKAIQLYSSLSSLSYLDIDSVFNLEDFYNVKDFRSGGLIGSQNRQNREYLRIILSHMKFDLQNYNPGYNKFKPLLDYIEACGLIIQCKNEALIITKEAWTRTCNNMVYYSHE